MKKISYLCKRKIDSIAKRIMMKRMFLLAGMVLTMVSAMAQSSGWSGGSGSSLDPYQISTAGQLQALAKSVNSGTSYVNVNFLLVADVDLGGSSWTPIGTYSDKGFAGVFDGGGHTISSLYINNSESEQGLFGYLNGGTVKNLIVSNSNVTANNHVGVVVGFNSGAVTACVVRNTTLTVSGSFCNGGGIAGNTFNGIIDGCYVTGCTLNSSYSNVGGITGTAYNSAIRNCGVTSSSFSEGAHMGAVVGNNDGGLVLSKNYYSTDVSGISGGCDGKDINDAASPDGAVRSQTPVNVVTPATTQTYAYSQPVVAQTAVSQPATAAVATAGNTPVAEAPTQFNTTVTSVQPAATPKTSASYIVKTKNVKKPAPKAVAPGADGTAKAEEQEEATDFMGKNFRFRSMCDWTPGMRFMVMPEKYDMLVNTFSDANTGKEVSSSRLRHKIMVYKGHEDMANGRVHINFTCEDDNKNYYYELPSGTFDDYCFGKLGVPTLAYLDDVDKARELLLGQELLTRTEFFREDTEYDGDGFREVRYPKNKVVTVKDIGVGTRSFPVKIIVEDGDGNQFYQNVTMSKINSGMRDDEFIVDNEKFLFQGSFEFNGGNMLVSSDIRSYLNQTVHTKHATSMSSKGSGKVRDVKVPKYTGFIIDEINPVKDTRYYTLTMRETETRRVYYKDVAFKEEDVEGNDMATVREYYFGYLFGMGEGALRNTSLETRTAIREGRVIPGMSEDEVMMAVGEPYQKLTNSDGLVEWFYTRSNGVLLVVQFSKGKVVKAGGRVAPKTNARAAKNGKGRRQTSTRRSSSSSSRAGGTWKNGTPL